jgi:hypothetical protein
MDLTRRNSKPATCWLCKQRVEPGEGWLEWSEGLKDSDGHRGYGRYTVRHAECPKKEEERTK